MPEWLSITITVVVGLAICVAMVWSLKQTGVGNWPGDSGGSL